MPPKGFTQEEWEKYERNRASRESRGLKPLDPGDWKARSDRVSRNYRRGEAYKNSIYKAMEDRGYNRQSGWDTEQVLEQQKGRRQDIGNSETGEGIEVKVGSAGGARSRRELALDRQAAEGDRMRVWVLQDKSQTKDRDPRFLKQLEKAERENPENFAVIDASDPKSIDSFEKRFPEYKHIGESVREGTAVFNHYDREYDQHQAQGKPYTLDQARAEYKEAASVKALADKGFAKSAKTIQAPPTMDQPDPNAEPVRTTPMAESGIRAARAGGRVVNGPEINTPEVTTGGARGAAVGGFRPAPGGAMRELG